MGVYSTLFFLLHHSMDLSFLGLEFSFSFCFSPSGVGPYFPVAWWLAQLKVLNCFTPLIVFLVLGGLLRAHFGLLSHWAFHKPRKRPFLTKHANGFWAA